MRLDISKLIEVGESIVYDDQIGICAQITKPVQHFSDEEGNEYQLKLVLTCTKFSHVEE